MAALPVVPVPSRDLQVSATAECPIGSGERPDLAKLLFSLDSETGVIQGQRASFGPGTQVQHGILKEET